MKYLLAVLIPTTALAGTYGLALAFTGSAVWPTLAMAVLLLIIGFFIMYKRK